MEVRIKAITYKPSEVKKIFDLVKELEKEYSCNCTLLDIETKCCPELRISQE